MEAVGDKVPDCSVHDISSVLRLHGAPHLQPQEALQRPDGCEFTQRSLSFRSLSVASAAHFRVNLARSPGMQPCVQRHAALSVRRRELCQCEASESSKRHGRREAEESKKGRLRSRRTIMKRFLGAKFVPHGRGRM